MRSFQTSLLTSMLVCVYCPCRECIRNQTWEIQIYTMIARLMGPTGGPSGAYMTQVGPMLAPWTLLSGYAAYSPGLFRQDKLIYLCYLGAMGAIILILTWNVHHHTLRRHGYLFISWCFIRWEMCWAGLFGVFISIKYYSIHIAVFPAYKVLHSICP